MTAFEEWTCVFPGKMGLSWKRAWDHIGTKAEAETYAQSYGNVIAVPVQLWEHINSCERRLVAAENQVAELKKGSK